MYRKIQVSHEPSFFPQNTSCFIGKSFFRNVCEDKFQRICKPYEDEVCSTKYEKKCEQLTKRQCYTDYRDVPYQDEECNDNYVRECPQIWEQDGNAKVWVPDTTKCVGLVSYLIT